MPRKVQERVVCFCGKTFTRLIGGMGRPRLYCSPKCGYEARRAAEAAQKGLTG
jgi:hypothetical protein